MPTEMSMHDAMQRPLKTEQLAYWFFRLNGCLTITNFLVHGEHPGCEGTDADIRAIRLPYRRELALSNDPMEDHCAFAPAQTSAGNALLDVMIAEIKKGRCCLNGPWTKPARRNMDRVLYAIGAIPESRVGAVAAALYQRNYYADDQYRFRLFALGREANWALRPEVVQITWREVLEWTFDRLNKYSRIKAQHDQWDYLGKELYRVMQANHDNQDAFVDELLARLEA